MKYGAQKEWFENLARDGNTPEALKKKPFLYGDLVDDYAAFWELMNTQIPMSEILAYCEFHKINDMAERKFFLKRILHLSSIYLKWHRSHKSSGDS